MYDTAVLDSGYLPDDTKELSRNVYDILQRSLSSPSSSDKAGSSSQEPEADDSNSKDEL